MQELAVRGSCFSYTELHKSRGQLLASAVQKQLLGSVVLRIGCTVDISSWGHLSGVLKVSCCSQRCTLVFTYTRKVAGEPVVRPVLVGGGGLVRLGNIMLVMEEHCKKTLLTFKQFSIMHSPKNIKPSLTCNIN